MDTQLISDWAGRAMSIAQILDDVRSGQAPVGQTPKDRIWSRNKTSLYRYRPVQKKLHPVPILLVYALINRPYIMDLIPEKSLVAFLVTHGFDVYLLDWGEPGPEDRDLSFDELVTTHMPRAIKKALRKSQAKDITLLGYCMGGTLAVIYSALFPNGPVKNLVLLGTPVDFADAGSYDYALDRRYFPLDKLVESYGSIPGKLVQLGNGSLRPLTNYAGSLMTLWGRADDREFIEDDWKPMAQWSNDSIDFPGQAFRQWVRDFYQENRLVQKKLIIDGRVVDLSKITISILNITAAKDNLITLPHQAKALEQYISSSDYEFFLVPSAHLNLSMGVEAHEITWPKIHDWLKSRSQARQ